MGELIGYNLYVVLEGKVFEEFVFVNFGIFVSLGCKDVVVIIGVSNILFKGLLVLLMKEVSNVCYLLYIKGLFSLVY